MQNNDCHLLRQTKVSRHLGPVGIEEQGTIQVNCFQVKQSWFLVGTKNKYFSDGNPLRNRSPNQGWGHNDLISQNSFFFFQESMKYFSPNLKAFVGLRILSTIIQYPPFYVHKSQNCFTFHILILSSYSGELKNIRRNLRKQPMQKWRNSKQFKFKKKCARWGWDRMSMLLFLACINIEKFCVSQRVGKDLVTE